MDFTLILLFSSISVSDAIWGKAAVTGVVGRAVTIDCHYDKQRYRSHSKYWCWGWYRTSCQVVVNTNDKNGRRGRFSITDHTRDGVFTVTMEDLTTGDADWYNCGIDTPGNDPMFAVRLHISYEPVSVPQLRFLSAPNASCSGGNVSISCKSISGSLPIQYQWHRETQSGASVISHSNKLDIQCGSISQSHQWYCTASNNKGTQQSEMVEVSDLQFLNETCRYLVRINSIGNEYSCPEITTAPMLTAHVPITRISSTDTQDSSIPVKNNRLVYIVLGLLGLLLIAAILSVLVLREQRKKRDLRIAASHRRTVGSRGAGNGDELETNTTYANVQKRSARSVAGSSEAATPLCTGDANITYAEVKFVQRSAKTESGTPATLSSDTGDSNIYSNITAQNPPSQDRKENPELELTEYATVVFSQRK